MEYAKIASNSGSSSGSAPERRTYTKRHLVGASAASAALTVLAMLALSGRPAAPTYSAPQYAAAPMQRTAAAPMPMSMPMQMPMPYGDAAMPPLAPAPLPVSRGFKPTNACATNIGKGACAGELTSYRQSVIRQCSNSLGGAKPTECKCFGVPARTPSGERYTPTVSESGLVFGGNACKCEFFTAMPGASQWGMILKCEV